MENESESSGQLRPHCKDGMEGRGNQGSRSKPTSLSGKRRIITLISVQNLEEEWMEKRQEMLGEAGGCGGTDV